MEAVGKFIGIMGLVLYSIGVLTTSIYQSQFNVTDFSMIQAQYVLTGVLVTLPIAAGLIGIFFCLLIFTDLAKVVTAKDEGDPKPYSNILHFFADKALQKKLKIILWIGSVTGTFIWFLLGGELILGIELSFVDSIGLMLYSILASGVTFIALFLIGEFVTINAMNEGYSKQAKSSPILWPLMIFYFLLSTGFYVGIFAQQLYSRVPAGMGGGKPLVAIVTMGKDFDADIKTDLEQPAQILVEGERWIILRDKDGRVYRIPREKVAAMVVSQKP